MKERLELAQQLLSPAGVIFVSIGDEEQAYLKVLMDGIFSEAQFAGMAVRKTRTVLNRLQNNFNNQHDYCLIYQRDPQQPLNGEQKNLNKYRNPDRDPNGKWYAGDPSIGLALAGKQANIFSIKNPFTGQVDNPPVNCHWRFTEQKLQTHVQSGKIKFYHHIRPGRRGFIFKRYQSEINTNFKTFDSLRFADTAYINARATKNLRQILDSDWKFFYPKPVNFIAELLRAVANPHALVLDFCCWIGHHRPGCSCFKPPGWWAPSFYFVYEQWKPDCRLVLWTTPSHHAGAEHSGENLLFVTEHQSTLRRAITSLWSAVQKFSSEPHRWQPW